MQFSIQSELLQKFPGLHLGVVVASGIDNTKDRSDLSAQLGQEAARIRANLTLDTLAQQPKIACWKAAYAAFGGEPKKNRSSVENLHKMILEGRELASINPLVDAYNVVSLKHVLPVGGEDLDCMQGNLQLRFASANETPIILLGEKDARPPKTGEVIYADDNSAFCRRWNWREADRTKLTAGTKNAILVIEGLPPTTKQEVQIAIKELAALVRTHCGGTISTSLLDESNAGIKF